MGRVDHRFCSIECGQRWHVDERRKALKLWRSQERGDDDR
jgi:hypothetical protein